MEARGPQVKIGVLINRHILTLRLKQMLEFKLLFAVDHNSPDYHEKDKMGIFYAESWALAHMLKLGAAGEITAMEFKQRNP
jgi:hypothetical protein